MMQRTARSFSISARAAWMASNIRFDIGFIGGRFRVIVAMRSRVSTSTS